MQLRPLQLPPVPTKPQLHSTKCHHTYNGTRVLPITTWVRSPTVRVAGDGEYALVYEIILYYKRNRACTIYRRYEDFVKLEGLLTPWKDSAIFSSSDDVRGMHLFLREALDKRPLECAMEYFLRRRMGDCGGL